MALFQSILIAAVVAFTVAAVVSDLRVRQIPNWLTVPTFALALAAHTLTAGLSGLGFALLGFAAGFGVLLILWLIGGGGGGDVKMMGALGAWLGATLTIQVFLVSAVVTLAITGGSMLYAFFSQGFVKMRKRYLSGPKPTRATRREARRRRLVPYAVPVALSTWIVLAIAWKMGALP